MGTLQVLRNATLILAFLVSGVLAETLHFDRFYRQTIGSPGLSHFAYYAFFKKDELLKCSQSRVAKTNLRTEVINTIDMF